MMNLSKADRARHLNALVYVKIDCVIDDYVQMLTGHYFLRKNAAACEKAFLDVNPAVADIHAHLYPTPIEDLRERRLDDFDSL